MLKKFLSHAFVGILSVASFLLSLGGFAWALFALWNAGNGGQPLILHFNDIQGITQIGGMGTVVFVGIFGVMATAINGFLAIALDEREAFLGKLLAIMSLVFGILLFIGFASIISVN